MPAFPDFVSTGSTGRFSMRGPGLRTATAVTPVAIAMTGTAFARKLRRPIIIATMGTHLKPRQSINLPLEGPLRRIAPILPGVQMRRIGQMPQVMRIVQA